MAIVKLDDYRTPPPRSQFEKYPLPFFDRDGLSTWAVEPSGDYAADVATGRRYAWEFLRSCDGTAGWARLSPAIVQDMIRGGSNDGIVTGFASALGEAVTQFVGPHQGPDPAG
jgi:hypothetical protein